MARKGETNPLIDMASWPTKYCLAEELAQLRDLYTIVEMSVLLQLNRARVATYFERRNPSPMPWAFYAYLLMVSVDALPPEVGRPPAYAVHHRIPARKTRAMLKRVEAKARREQRAMERQAAAKAKGDQEARDGLPAGKIPIRP